jgi:hypothetical protein
MMETVKTIASACGEYCAEIVPRPTGGFQVTVYQHREEWVPGYGMVGEYWGRVSPSVMLADSMERAAELAQEEFRSYGTTAAVG